MASQHNQLHVFFQRFVVRFCTERQAEESSLTRSDETAHARGRSSKSSTAFVLAYVLFS